MFNISKKSYNAREQEWIESQASEAGSTAPTKLSPEKKISIGLEVNDEVKKGSAYGLGSQTSSGCLKEGLTSGYSSSSSHAQKVFDTLHYEVDTLKKACKEDRNASEANYKALENMMKNFMIK